MKFKIKLFLLLMLAPSGFAKTSPNQKVEITYIANEGVFIKQGETKILIDAHHYKGNPYYMPVANSRLEKMVNGLPPFDRVNLILATHIHADHFDAQSVGRHLFFNPKTTFVAAKQMTDSIKKEFDNFKKVEKQIKTVTPEWKQFAEVTIDDIEIKVLGLRHGSKKFKSIQNMGYIIKIGDVKLLHIGDADATVENFEAFKLPNEAIDIAFIPYWYLTHKPFNEIVNRYIQPGRIIAVHIPPEDAEEATDKILSTYPGAIIFSKAMQKVVF